MTPKEWGDLPQEDRLFLEAAAIEQGKRTADEYDSHDALSM